MGVKSIAKQLVAGWIQVFLCYVKCVNYCFVLMVILKDSINNAICSMFAIAIFDDS
jgi:hypothetical protein